MLFAQLDTSWVGPVIQLVQLGGFGALVWFFVYNRMPGMEKAALDERNAWMTCLQGHDDKFLAYMQKRDEKFESLLERCIKAIEEGNRAKHP
jgi:hypothetical protein